MSGALVLAAALAGALGALPMPPSQEAPLLSRGHRTRALNASWGTAWFRGPGSDDAKSDFGFVGFYPQLGWFQTSRLELFGEATVHAYYEPAGVFAGVIGIAGRYHFHDDRRWTPYVLLGGGLGWTSLDELVEIDRTFNFQTVVGAGLRQITRRGPGWIIEFRNHHTSNAGTRGENIGVNAATLVVGMHWVIRPR